MHSRHIKTDNTKMTHKQIIFKHKVLSYLLALLVIFGGALAFENLKYQSLKSSKSTDFKNKQSPFISNHAQSNKDNQLAQKIMPNFNAEGKVNDTLKYSARELIDMILELEERNGFVFTPDDISYIQQKLQWLVDLGSDAVPAIDDFLRTQRDFVFTNFKGSERLHHGSLRLALFDVLEKIGGYQEEAILFENFKQTSNPTELAALGHYLEKKDPQYYRPFILEAARNTLSSLSEEDMNNPDVGILFKIIQDYGDENIVSFLEGLPDEKWRKFTSIVLANMPNGKGIAALTDMIQQNPDLSDTSTVFALQMLAQSSEYPEAESALLESVDNHQIPDDNWPRIAQMMAGIYRFQPVSPRFEVNEDNKTSDILAVNRMDSDGEVVYRVKYNLTAEQIKRRLGLIEKMLTKDLSSTATRSLKQQHKELFALYSQKTNHKQRQSIH